ncbi:MAG: helix-turn-helix domain-containing protein, partial [Verrucomicrobiota bacterium]
MNTNAVRDILDRKKMTQKELADIVGLSATGLNQILQGKLTPKIRTVEKIAAALGVQVSLLLAPGPVTVQNGHINIVGDSRGNMKHHFGGENIYTSTAEIESMRKEIESFKELLKAKDETISSLKMTISLY